MSFAVPVLISARDRPLYLWATLDNLYRRTRYPHRFVLLDMASEDPSVRRVVAGFERRGMFDEIIWAKRNHQEIVWNAIWRLGDHGAPYVGYVESDVIIEPTNPCWLERLVGLMEGNPRLAMLGAAIDWEDFVDLETARRLAGDMPEPRLRDLIKADSPERLQDLSDAEGADIIHPHNPPGRLLLLRNSALREVGPGGIDGDLHNRFIAAGYETGVATAVRHRHLSLLHIFDYPEYDYAARTRFWGGMNAGELPADPGTGLPRSNLHAKALEFSGYVRRFGAYLASASMRLRRRSNAVLSRLKAPFVSGVQARFAGRGPAASGSLRGSPRRPSAAE